MHIVKVYYASPTYAKYVGIAHYKVYTLCMNIKAAITSFKFFVVYYYVYIHLLE